MKTFKITYKNTYGENDTMIEMAAEKWMIENKIEEWGLGETISIEQL